jgi:hypothetical protein
MIQHTTNASSTGRLLACSSIGFQDPPASTSQQQHIHSSICPQHDIIFLQQQQHPHPQPSPSSLGLFCSTTAPPLLSIVAAVIPAVPTRVDSFSIEVESKGNFPLKSHLRSHRKSQSHWKFPGRTSRTDEFEDGRLLSRFGRRAS